MRFFQRTPPPERTTPDEARDPAYYEARLQYQAQKDRAMEKQIELLARLNRLGYDFDLATRAGTQRPSDDVSH